MQCLIRFLRERRKGLVLLSVVYVFAFHFVYSHYWRKSSPTASFHNVIVPSQHSLNSLEAGPSKHQRPSDPDDQQNNGLLSSLWNFRLPQLNFLGNSRNDDEAASSLDIHVEDGQLGHTGEVIGAQSKPHSRSSQSSKIVVAIGGGITSRGVHGINQFSNFTEKFQFFHTFMPSFCATASPNYTYRFYFAYDHNDDVFGKPIVSVEFQKAFIAETKRLCFDKSGIQTSLHLVQCSHTRRPTWAQNDAMLEAYLDHVDYFYRINDDTRMISAGWTEAFIQVLNKYDPPRVGVVGPNHHGGNLAVLTYDFVHRTHVDIFGFYYPRLFTDWWGDDWVTLVYKPNRTTKLQHIQLSHTLALGQRYSVRANLGGRLPGQLDIDRVTLRRYIAAVQQYGTSSSLSTSSDGRRVISMSLYGKDPRYTWGVIRNAQLVPVYFPGWRLRVYVPSASSDASSSLEVPQRFINKLRLLGADVVRVRSRVVNGTKSGLGPRDWRLLVADDESVEYFLIRDAESRLNDRDAAAVREWITEVAQRTKNGFVDAYSIHCIRDHPKHANRAVVDGLWGGRPAALRRQLGTKLTTAFLRKLSSSKGGTDTVNSTAGDDRKVKNQSSQSTSVLEEVLLPFVVGDGASAYCHDVVSPCDRWTNGTSTIKSNSIRRPFSTSRQGRQYIGQKYDEHQEIASGDDSAQLTSDVSCSGLKTSTISTA